MLSGLVMGVCMAGLALYLQFLDTSPGVIEFSNYITIVTKPDQRDSYNKHVYSLEEVML